MKKKNPPLYCHLPLYTTGTMWHIFNVIKLSQRLSCDPISAFTCINIQCLSVIVRQTIILQLFGLLLVIVVAKCVPAGA